MSNCVLSYKNHAAYAVAGTMTFDADYPVSNVITPRLGEKAVATGAGNFEVYINQGSPTLAATIGVIAILNHNIISIDDPTNIEIIAYFTDGSAATIYPSSTFFQEYYTQQDGTFQSHMILVPTDTQFDTKRVWKVSFGFAAPSLVICGSKNPYTGVITQQQLSIGGIWIGPKFTPLINASIDGFAQSVEDNSQVVRTIGGHVWTSPEIRQRTATITFPGLFESEVYALAPAQSLQQLAAYCGVSRPLIVVPTVADEALMYAQGIYGYLSAPPSWNSYEKAALSGVMTRLYQGSIEILEAR